MLLIKILISFLSFSGHNSLFGSQILTDAGFILNNALANFDASSSNPTIQGSSFENLYPPKDDTNSTIIIPKFGAPPDHGNVQDRASKEVTESDQHHPLSWNQEQNFSRVEKTLRREKRFEVPESRPRAAIWGSSVANNGLVGGKRPISLSTPIIAVEMGQTCGRRLVLGQCDFHLSFFLYCIEVWLSLIFSENKLIIISLLFHTRWK